MEQLLALQTLQFDMPPKTEEERVMMEKIRDQIPSPILAHYERLVLRRKKGVAIARNGVCNECHLRIPGGTLATLAYDNEVHICDNCSRYLYLPDEEPLDFAKPRPSGGISPPRPHRSIIMDAECIRPSSLAMTLADFSNPGLVIPRLRGGEATSVIKELAQRLSVEVRLPDMLHFYQAVLNREFMESTDTKVEMAFPHTRVVGLKNLVFALGRSDEPLHWGVNPTQSVRLVFLSAVPATDATQYLLLMSGIARLSCESALVTRMLGANDAFEMLNVLRQIPLRSRLFSDAQAQ